MNTQLDLIKNALEYYDKENDKYNKILKKVVRHSFEDTKGDLNPSFITLYDKNDKKLLTAEYQSIGYYYELFKLWIWSWAKPNPKKTVSLSRKILSYGLEYDSDPEDLLMCIFRSRLITSRFIIPNKTQLDVHIAIAGYLSKHPIYYKYKKVLQNDTDNILTYYIALINIKVY